MGIGNFVKKFVPAPLRSKVVQSFDPYQQGILTILRGMDPGYATIFDIGANVGDVTKCMLETFPSASVYSFEPCNDTYGKLVENVRALGQESRWHPYQLGFLDQAGDEILNITTFHGANSMLQLTDEFSTINPGIQVVAQEKIHLVRLDDFVAENKIKHIDLVKIDVEGVELKILNGGLSTLTNLVDTVIVEMSFVRSPRKNGEFIKIFQVMHDCGFAPALVYDLAHADATTDWKLAQFDCVFKKF